jgi:hypothetical protein
MHVSRKSNQELVIVDSSIWISVFLLCVCLPVSYQTFIQGKPKGFLICGVFLLFALLFWRKETVIFDAARQQVEWNRRRLFKVANGVVPFNEITAIGTEASSGQHGLTYRLTILTTKESVPMSDAYGGNPNHYEALKAQIEQFLNLDPAKSPPSIVGDEASIRSLLKQGRKVDAIQLVRTTQKISLTEAVDRVNAIDEAMKTAQ